MRLSSWAFVAAQTDISELTQIVLQQDSEASSTPAVPALSLFVLLGVWRAQAKGRVVWSWL